MWRVRQSDKFRGFEDSEDSRIREVKKLYVQVAREGTEKQQKPPKQEYSKTKNWETGSSNIKNTLNKKS